VSDTPKPVAADNAPRRRSPPRRVEVRRVQVLSPTMRRITLTGPELASFVVPLPASYIKLVFPAPGEREAAAPTPDGPKSPWMRTYTPRRIDAAALELDVDFVLHGDGPASTWAEQASPGQVLYMMGPGPGHKLDPDAREHWLIGDDSALPAFETILEALPAHARATIWVEVVDDAEQRPLPNPGASVIHWVPRGTDNTAAGRALDAALRAAPRPPADAQVYIACEAMAMRRIRQLLIDELKVPRSQVIGRGYWKLGAVNHPDHDYGE
jgi:NADPH-dependent ferric siderophore reductase